MKAAPAPEDDVTSNVGSFARIAAAWASHQAELRRFLVRAVRDEGLAGDILQDVFMKALGQGSGFCRVDNRRAWLFRVARNAVVPMRGLPRTRYRFPSTWQPIQRRL